MARFRLVLAAVLAVTGLAHPARAEVSDVWRPITEESVVEILTKDADGAARDTKVWIVVLDQAGFVRTNDSRWLENIRRGSDVALRVDGAPVPVQVEEVADAATKARVEEAFKEKYGTTQRIMSALRLREPTVLRLRQRAAP